MNIIEAIKDEHVFRPFLGKDLTTWKNWMAALRVLYGLPIKSANSRQLVKESMGRRADLLPAEGFTTALFLTGRRSGKSRVAAIIGAYEAVLAGHEHKLSKGEKGIVAVCSPTKYQSRIVTGYLRALFETPMLANEVTGETREGFELKSGTRIEILAGDWKHIRGYTLLAAIVDEASFFSYDLESKITDTELVRAIKPSLATVGGKLICISSPYARKGWCYQQWKKHFRNDQSNVLVWNCPSRIMNETLPQSVVDAALAEDFQAAKSEYLGEFRDDVILFLDRNLLEQYVAKGRKESLPRPDTTYVAFCDLSGGRGDDAGLSIAHRLGGKIIIDLARRWRPPFSPQQVVGEMASLAKQYGIRRITGDNYSAEFAASAFASNGIRYEKSELPASGLYLEFLPRLCSGEIELPDDDFLINQFANLERRTRSGGKDQISHPPGQHDDLANAVAGVVVCAAAKRIRTVGAL